MGRQVRLLGWFCLLMLSVSTVDAAEFPRLRAFHGDFTVRVFLKRRPVGLRGQRWAVRASTEGNQKGFVRSPSSLRSYFADTSFEIFPLGNSATIGTDRRGQLFELNPGAIVAGRLVVSSERAVRQALLRGADGRVSTGASSGLLPMTALDVELLNTSKESRRPAF